MSSKALDDGVPRRLLEGRHHDPHSVLGAHPTGDGVIVRVMHHDATAAELLLEGGKTAPMKRVRGGLFTATIAGASMPLRYRVRFRFVDGNAWERDDQYRFPPTIGEVDLHLFNEGTHRRLWEKLGAHATAVNGVAGVAFSVWAPSAQRVSVVGDFSQWDGRIYPMRVLGSSGVWELFIPGIEAGALYKYEILTRDGDIRLKADPFAFKLEQHPGTASIVEPQSAYEWKDSAWMEQREAHDMRREPMLAYEVHLGSWARAENGNRFLTYRELAPRLGEHVEKLRVTHVALLPALEHRVYDRK
jgi:1,4-alpha-glucan branching enzyme